MKLLNEGPYITKELSLQDKKTLIEPGNALNPGGDGSWDKEDLKTPWYITNDPSKDAEWDARDRDFWNKGEEYPYLYSILIGGDTVDYHYDSIGPETLANYGLEKYFQENN